MKETIIKYFSSIVDIVNIFFSKNMLYLFLFVFALVSIQFCNHNNNMRGKRMIVLYTIMTLFLVVFNPFLFDLSMNYPVLGYEVFARIWLMCPIWVAISYCISATAVHNYFRPMPLKRIVTIAFAGLIIAFGASNSTLKMMNDVSCKYKVRSESVEIADKILAYSNGEPTVLFIYVPKTQDDANYINGGTIYEGIRQYTGTIATYRYEYTEEIWNNYYLSEIIPVGNITSDAYVCEFLNIAHEENGFEFIAFPDDPRILDRMEYCGYEYIDHIAGYYFFQVAD